MLIRGTNLLLLKKQLGSDINLRGEEPGSRLTITHNIDHHTQEVVKLLNGLRYPTVSPQPLEVQTIQPHPYPPRQQQVAPAAIGKGDPLY